MRKHFAFYLILLFSTTIQAQRSHYEAEAKWLPINGATEKFSYASTDTSKTPIGPYVWKLNLQNPGTKWFEVAQIKVNFSNGLPEGEIEMIHYTVNFEINDFDQQGVNLQTIGHRSLLKGKYVKGNPTGIWQYEYGTFDDKEKRQVLTLNTVNNTLHFQNDTLNLNGIVNAEGNFEGKWILNIKMKPTQEFSYEKGILLNLNIGGKSFFEEIFKLTKEQLKSIDSIAPADKNLPWIWSAGFQPTDSLYLTQIPLARTMEVALVPYSIAQFYFRQHPLISSPLITGVKRLYFELGPDEQKRMKSATQKLDYIDSLLNAKLEQPVFQLRRESNFKIDSLLKITEGYSIESERYKHLIEEFIQVESRFIAPEYLPAAGQKIRSHNDFTNYLEQLTNTLYLQVESHVEVLKESIEFLRLQGTVEELEEEWVFLKDDILTYVPQENANAFAVSIYNRFVVNDFEIRRRDYASLNSFEERRSFLATTIEYYEHFRIFFKNKQYLMITDVNDEFMQQYTKYLYNPYMGVNNVEVVVMKKFLSNLLDQFWPFLLSNLSQVNNGEDFQEKFAKALTYKHALLQLADDNSSNAKKIERRGRKETDMEEFENLVKEYILSIQNEE